MRQVCLLGATGSIGDSTVDVIRQHPDRFSLYAVAAHSNWKKVAEIAQKFKVKQLCMFDANAAKELSRALNRPVLSGIEGLKELALDPNTDLIVNAVMGSVGCLPTLAAIAAGKHVALANKETMVMAGPVIQDALKENPKAYITPIDSEHNAIFQCLAGRSSEEVECLQITASGGPFREWPKEKFETITVKDALNHPVWSMGKKITIDSASMMNKGFEVIEAKWLFGVKPEQIEVVVHPQSVIHSMVEYKDGAVIAQLGHPDMREPIQYALTWPLRLPLNNRKLNFADLAKMTFYAPDKEKFPALELAYRSLEKGGNMACIMNAANEAAVAAFLQEKIGFYDITDVVSGCMAGADFAASPDLDAIFRTNEDTLAMAAEKISRLSGRKSF